MSVKWYKRSICISIEKKNLQNFKNLYKKKKKPVHKKKKPVHKKIKPEQKKKKPVQKKKKNRRNIPIPCVVAFFLFINHATCRKKNKKEKKNLHTNLHKNLHNTRKL
jgi:hypothetical protein